MADETEHTITIAPDGEGYLVSVEPAPPGDTFDKRYPAYRDARGYGRGLRLHRQWKLVDLVEGASK